jgi:hypothetical protein
MCTVLLPAGVNPTAVKTKLIIIIIIIIIIPAMMTILGPLRINVTYTDYQRAHLQYLWEYTGRHK